MCLAGYDELYSAASITNQISIETDRERMLEFACYGIDRLDVDAAQ